MLAGFRFLHIGGGEFRWEHNLTMPTHVCDCTEMTDEEFDAYATPFAGSIPPSPEPHGEG